MQNETTKAKSKGPLSPEAMEKLSTQIQSAKIELRPTDQLLPYARNARKHEDWQVAQIAASIKEFGFTNPVLIDESGEIVAGHGRVMAALKLDLPQVPCITLGHLTTTQRRAYVLADNQLALNSSWDVDMLRTELQELQLADFDITITGIESSLLMIEEPDYSVLDGDDSASEDKISHMSDGVKKAIQIEFETEDYEEAFQLVKFWRGRGGYVGGMIVDFLKKEKEKI